MWDRYDPRDAEDRQRAGSWDRPRGSRGGRSDRDDDRSLDPPDVFVREVDLPLGPERELVRDRDRTRVMVLDAVLSDPESSGSVRRATRSGTSPAPSASG